MESIKIVDDFLNKDDLQLLTSIISSKKWAPHSSRGREMVNTPFWVTDLKQDVFFDEYIFNLSNETIVFNGGIIVSSKECFNFPPIEKALRLLIFVEFVSFKYLI